MIDETSTQQLKRVPQWFLRLKAFHAAGGTLYACTAAEACGVIALAGLTAAIDGASGLAVAAAALTASLGYLRKLKGDIRSANGFKIKREQ
jgi:hypothetical protein